MSHYNFEVINVIESPAACEIHSIIHFLNARKFLLVKLCEVYGENSISEGKMQKSVCEFKSGRENIHNESQSGRLTVFPQNLVAAVDAKI